MPDEIDTLDTSQSSSQNFLLDGISEAFSHSQNSSQDLTLERIAEIFSQSATASHSLEQGLLNTLTNSATSTQALVQGMLEVLGNSQQNDPNLFPGRSQIPVLRTSPSGVEPLVQVLSDSENKHYFINDDPLVVLEVISQVPDDQTVTIETSYVQDDLQLEERVVSIPAGGTKYIGAFPFYVYNFEIIKVNVNPSNNGLKFRAFKVM